MLRYAAAMLLRHATLMPYFAVDVDVGADARLMLLPLLLPIAAVADTRH